MSSEEGEEIFLEDYPQVQFKIVNDENGEGCHYTLKNFQLKDVNRLRQIFYRMLKTMAIETIEIIENTTDFIDETIAARLGLIPIRCQGVEDIPVIKNTNNLEDEITDGVDFSIAVDVPKNKSKKFYNVTEKDISFADDRCQTVTKNTPIFFLRPGQRFELVGKIQKGIGSMHVKWIPVASVIYERPNEEEYILKVVTKGQLTCQEIIQEAMDILEKEKSPSK